jgi:uncharacterized peroxidase-related enzyme
MTRISMQDAASATGPTKQIFDAMQKSLGTVPNMVRAMAASPAAVQAYAQFAGALQHAKLSGGVREQIALLTAQTNGCDYCLSAHTALGKMAGLSGPDLERARHGEASDPKATAALRFARAVLETGGGVSEAQFRAAREAGLSDGELAEVVAAVALNVYTNFFNRAFDVDVDFPRVAAHAGHAG